MNLAMEPSELQRLSDEWCRKHGVKSYPSVAMLTYMAERQVEHTSRLLNQRHRMESSRSLGQRDGELEIIG